MNRLPLLALLLPCTLLASTPVELTQEEFKMFRHWQKAMGDPRVEKIKPQARNAAIAKDARFKLKEMERAIEKGEAAGDLKAACEGSIRGALADGPLAGRLNSVEVDVSEPHAVAYLQWLNANPSRLEEEASLVAALSARACPIAGTFQLWAQDQASPKTRVFQALISSSAAGKINPARAADFAATRYIRLFEGVKNIAQGDLIAPEGGPGGGQGTGGGTVAGGRQ